jgi:hypothetical protein
LVGCGASQTPAPSAAPRQQAYTTKTPINMVGVIDKNIAPPSQITNIENNAVGLMDYVKKGDWNKAKEKLNKIKTEYNTLNPLLQVTDTSRTLVNNMNNSIGNLEKQIISKKSYDTMLEANKMTKLTADAKDMYKETFPTGVDKIGYYDRQIVLNAEKANWKEADINYRSLESLWVSIRYGLNKEYDTDRVKLTASIADLKKSISDKNTANVKIYAKKVEDNLAIIKSDLQKQLGTR